MRIFLLHVVMRMWVLLPSMQFIVDQRDASRMMTNRPDKQSCMQISRSSTHALATPSPKVLVGHPLDTIKVRIQTMDVIPGQKPQYSVSVQYFPLNPAACLECFMTPLHLFLHS